MKKPSLNGFLLCLLLLTVCLQLPLYPGIAGASETTETVETTIIKNANIFLPNGAWQAESFILLSGCKIKAVGLMKQLDQNQIYDNEYDAEGGFVYPAFIDAFYTGLQRKKADSKGKKKEPGDRRGRASVDKTIRKPLLERDYFIGRNTADELELNLTNRKKCLSQGFAYAHIVSADGIMGGSTCVISLAADSAAQTVLTTGNFMSYRFKMSPTSYPSTYGGLVAEFKQLKEDCSFYKRQKQQQFFNPTQRAPYRPELDTLNPYFKGRKSFLMVAKNVVEQRLAQLLKKELNLSTVLVGGSDTWRRPVPSSDPVILRLGFKPPLNSKYAELGETLKEKAEKTIYPEKFAEFLKTHKNVSLTAPKSGDYKTLFKSIRRLVKQGISEAQIIASLTTVPARLLNISQFAGAIKPGLLAGLLVTDKKIVEEKATLKTIFAEGKEISLKSGKGKLKPPAANLTGNWAVKVDSARGTHQLKLELKQSENDVTGSLTSPMLGTAQISEGIISGDEFSFSAAFSFSGTELIVSVSVKVTDKTMEGNVTLGGMGEGTFSAQPEDASNADFQGGE